MYNHSIFDFLNEENKLSLQKCSTKNSGEIVEDYEVEITTKIMIKNTDNKSDSINYENGSALLVVLTDINRSAAASKN